MNGQAPWLAGSSCTQHQLGVPGYAAHGRDDLVDRQRVELLDPHDRGVGGAGRLAVLDQVVVDLAGAQQHLRDRGRVRCRSGPG